MVPVILTSVAWYAIPKGIKYLTTDCEVDPQSKIECIREKLFDYKSALEEFVCANAFTRFTYKALQIPYSYMWLSVLIAPGLKKPQLVTSPADRFLQMAICYSLYSSKCFLKFFIRNPLGIECITSLWGLRILRAGVVLDFIRNSLSEDRELREKDSFWQMMMVLKLRLKASDAYDFLRVRGKENLLAVVERVKCYKSEREINDLLEIIRSRFPERVDSLEEDFLKYQSQQVQEILLNVRNFMDNFSILDSLTLYRISSPSVFECISSMIPPCLSQLLFQHQYEYHLPNLPDYPEDIHDTDPILNKIQCPLLFRPIRSAVVDPTNQQTVYDRKALEAYLEHKRTSPITQKEISGTFYPHLERGSKYDTILRYRKACLQLEKLKDSEEFIANLKQVFTEVYKLENPLHLKKASKKVRDFFQVGLLNAYDVRGLEYEDCLQAEILRMNIPDLLSAQAPYNYKLCKLEHNLRQSNRDEVTNFGIKTWMRIPQEMLVSEDFDRLRNPRNPLELTIENFDQYRFIEEEVNREIQKIKTEGKELLKVFL